MKMKTIAEACAPLNKLIRMDMPIRLAYAVMQLATTLEPEWDFYRNQLVIGKKPEEIDELEIDKHFECVKIPLSTNITLTACDIKALSPFVEFIEEEATA